VEEVDLTDGKQSVQEVLQKQREDAVKSQTKPEEKPTTFNTFNCVICMDMPTDLTATACGASSFISVYSQEQADKYKATSSATLVSWKPSLQAKTAQALANRSARNAPSAGSSSTAPNPPISYPCCLRKAWRLSQERRHLHHPVLLLPRYNEVYMDIVFSLTCVLYWTLFAY
jgi:hypothetical protein